jgi:hypothetical protein
MMASAARNSERGEIRFLKMVSMDEKLYGLCLKAAVLGTRMQLPLFFSADFILK